MCIAGLYFVFLLLQSLIVGYYSDNGNSTLTQNDNFNIESLYNYFSQDTTTNPTKRIEKRSINKNQYPVIAPSPSPRKKQTIQNYAKKHYELVDIFWKKNRKIVGAKANSSGQIKNTNAKNKSNRKWATIKPLTPPVPQTAPHVTTTSKIEFYYLDDTPLANTGKSRQIFHWQNVEAIGSTNVPFLIFHLRAPVYTPSTNVNNATKLTQKQTVRVSRVQLNKLNNKVNKSDISTLLPLLKKEDDAKLKKRPDLRRPFLSEYYFDQNVFSKKTTEAYIATESLTDTTHDTSTQSAINKSSIIYDKIKFFETYDQFTPETFDVKDNNSKTYQNKSNLADRNQRVLLEHLENGQNSHDHIQAKHAKKHITETFQKANQLADEAPKSKFMIKTTTHKKLANATSYFINGSTEPEPNTGPYLEYSAETARWSDYPFTAVYIYEPSQVHCDAAAINTHWLIASGSCLSRVKKPQESFEAYGEGRSAFVAYCGDQWWAPERVAYVKYTVVHPSYHHKDKLRQHLYNIGAIQVVNSLKSSCAEWAPVSLMSHQLSPTPGGNKASAVGWGLDRFDTRYLSSELPKLPLIVYKSHVYIDSCPGNNGYSKMKNLDVGAVKNVHCLALPPYYGETKDPVHGALLLADGKLIALYLQEERRGYGEQSAQYTGVWRLIPWLMDVAREPEELETIAFDV